jgi:hypothetical protein
VPSSGQCDCFQGDVCNYGTCGQGTVTQATCGPSGWSLENNSGSNGCTQCGSLVCSMTEICVEVDKANGGVFGNGCAPDQCTSGQMPACGGCDSVCPVLTTCQGYDQSTNTLTCKLN